MSRDPLLAWRTLPPSDGYKVRRTFKVVGGLHYIKGNASPYFSLTCWSHRVGFPNQCQSGGADHEAILKSFPKFADMAALHLSDMNGAPSHAIANGLYVLAACLPGHLGQDYHAGNSKRNMPCTPPPDKPWQTTEHRLMTHDECLANFACFCRVPVEEATAFVATVLTIADTQGNDVAKRAWSAEVERLRPLWRQQAEACIAKHKLVVYGDTWPPKDKA